MPSIPLPFVVALLLAIALYRLLRREDEPANPFFVALIAASMLQLGLLGLRWGYGMDALRLLQPVLAAGLAPLTWLAFSSFASGHASAGSLRTLWPHALPAMLVIALLVTQSGLIDPALIVIFLGYGIALITLTLTGPDGLDRVKFEGALSLYRALQVAGAVLICSALSDAAIALNVFGTARSHIAEISGFGSLGFIVVLGAAAVIAGRNVPDETSSEDAPALPEDRDESEDDVRVMADLEAMMAAKELYRNPDLSLDRLARRMALPARRISGAINRTRAINVSQYVNEHRIAAACRSLRVTDAPITQILFEVGFQTKSNFNREFLRVTGLSPSRWRAEQDSIPPQASAPQRGPEASTDVKVTTGESAR